MWSPRGHDTCEPGKACGGGVLGSLTGATLPAPSAAPAPLPGAVCPAGASHTMMHRATARPGRFCAPFLRPAGVKFIVVKGGVAASVQPSVVATPES